MKKDTVSSCALVDGTPLTHAQMRKGISIINGKWKLEILWALSQRVHRFNELQRAVPKITQHMLTARLRELEKDGLITRTIYAEIPPRVEYQLTAKARRLAPVFQAVARWVLEEEEALSK